MHGQKKQPGLIFLIVFLAITPLVYGESDLTQQGIAFLKAQRFDEAINVFSRVIKADPGNAKAVYYRGMARYYRGDLDPAIADYTIALKKDPGIIDAYTSRGVAFFRKGDYQRAQKDLDLILKKNPDNANAINQKAWMLAVCPDPRYRDGKKALELSKRAINIKTTPNYLDTLAAVYAENGQYQEAARVQRKVIALLTQEERLDRLDIYLERLKKYEAGEPWREDNERIDTPETEIPELESLEPETSETVEKKTAPPSPSPKKTAVAAAPVVTQTQKPVEKKTESASQPKPVAPPTVSGMYPYTIFISTYQDPKVTKNKVINLRKNGDPAFVSHSYFKDSGHWYQIFFGWYKSIADANTAAEKLQKRNFRKTIVVKKPYAVQAGIFSSKATLKKMETGLVALNYPAYLIPETNEPGKIRLLIGAYSTEIVPDKLIETLTTAGFEPKVVRR
ncbi:MAG: tetratricopeptide repeat protein [Thermodesulfobacteriota bacterium]|nr:tetratricopeptide repeat protein [Thermodesulfobacteriota bacterium]